MSNLTAAARVYAEAKTALDTAMKNERDANEAVTLAGDATIEAEKAYRIAVSTLREAAMTVVS